MASDVNSTIEKLIETNRDAEKGFREASENVENPGLKTFFLEQSSERGRFAAELQSELALTGQAGEDRVGGRGAREGGSVAGAMHRA